MNMQEQQKNYEAGSDNDEGHKAGRWEAGQAVNLCCWVDFQTDFLMIFYKPIAFSFSAAALPSQPSSIHQLLPPSTTSSLIAISPRVPRRPDTGIIQVETWTPTISCFPCHL